MIPSNLERPIMNPVQALMRLAPVTSRLDETDMASVSGILASARKLFLSQSYETEADRRQVSRYIVTGSVIAIEPFRRIL
jgi:hypothetical protein